MKKKFKAGPETLTKMVLFFANVLESRETEEQMKEAFSGIKPIINKRGNKEFLLNFDKKKGFALFLEISSDQICMEASDDYNFAKTIINEDSYAAKWLRANY